jgi:hypothetical protein
LVGFDGLFILGVFVRCKQKLVQIRTFLLLTPKGLSDMVSAPTNTGGMDDTAREQAEVLGDVPNGAEIPNQIHGHIGSVRSRIALRGVWWIGTERATARNQRKLYRSDDHKMTDSIEERMKQRQAKVDAEKERDDRLWLAGMAMQGMMAAGVDDIAIIADNSWAMADAMLEAENGQAQG